MKNIAIIPARSGSKGLKNKNIKLLNGKPLIAYSIEAAIKSKMFDVVHVSTDSEEYADIAKRYGADVPFLRSAETSSDTASSWDAVKEVLNKYSELGKDFDTFMLLQPTSPLRTDEDVVKSYKLFEEKKAITIVSVCEVEHSPLQCNTLPEDLSMEGFERDEVKNLRRQDMPTYYRFNGAVYLSDVSHFIKTGDIYEKDCFAYIMDKRASIDIDDEYDFMILEAIIKANSTK